MIALTTQVKELQKALSEFKEIRSFLSAERAKIEGTNNTETWLKILLSEEEFNLWQNISNEYVILNKHLSVESTDLLRDHILDYYSRQKLTIAKRELDILTFDKNPTKNPTADYYFFEYLSAIGHWRNKFHLGGEGVYKTLKEAEDAYETLVESSNIESSNIRISPKFLNSDNSDSQWKNNQVHRIANELLRSIALEHDHLKHKNKITVARGIRLMVVEKFPIKHKRYVDLFHRITKLIHETGEKLNSRSKKIQLFFDPLNKLTHDWSCYGSSQFERLIFLKQPRVLSRDDLKLAKIWTSKTENIVNKNWLANKMQSARAAEKVALKIYKNLYGHAIDVSLTQVSNPSSRDWLLGDVKSNGCLIDIKNARRSKHSEKAYSEHCVPRFKNDRMGDDVIISGILSPYDKDGGLGGEVVWMGETTYGRIRNLARLFSSPYLDIDFSRFLDQKNSFIPRWAFDYPQLFYKKRDENLNRLRSIKCNPRLLVKYFRPSLPIRILAGWNNFEGFSSEIQQEGASLVERFNDIGKIRRPVLFLHIISRFVNSMQREKHFAADSLRRCIYHSDDKEKEWPLGISDPLSVIDDLIKTLGEMQSIHFDSELRGYKFFRLAGPHILQGKREKYSPYKTIYAYCGGRDLDTNAACGTYPIYMGMNSHEMHCSDCFKLVCKHCGFCSRNCTSLDDRIKRMKKGRAVDS